MAIDVPGPSAATGGPPDLSAAHESARRAIADGRLPCAVLGVVDATGRMDIRSVALGDRPVDGDTIFFLASVTKAIVATAVMRYADEGRLDLYAPLARYLPGFDRADQASVTAAHVLTHTSGLPDMPIETLRAQRPSYERALAEALASRPTFEPGTRYAYCSSAWLLLAETMAQLSRRPFDDALRLRLTGPLGMHDTGFDPRAARTRVVPVVGFRIQNRLVQELLLRFLVRARLPGGGLFGTAHDLLRLGRALLPRTDDAAPRVLSQAAIDEMARLRTAGLTVEAEDGSIHEVRQALGWRKPSAGWPGSASAITHAGIAGSRLWVDPEAGFAFAFMTNLWQAPDEPCLEALRELYAGVS